MVELECQSARRRQLALRLLEQLRAADLSGARRAPQQQIAGGAIWAIGADAMVGNPLADLVQPLTLLHGPDDGECHQAGGMRIGSRSLDIDGARRVVDCAD